MTIKSSFKVTLHGPDILADLNLKIKKFTGGEVQVTIPDASRISEYDLDMIEVIAELKCSDGVMLLAQIKSIIDSYNIKKALVALQMVYTPYGRYDRKMTEGDSFSLKVFATHLNLMKFDQVFVYDPHSDVQGGVFDNLIIVEQHKCILQLANAGIITPEIYTAVVSPDAGAIKKSFEAAKILKIPNIIRADKKRDLVTNDIVETLVYDEENILPGATVLIVDDCLDGGRTFKELARILKAKGAARVDLYITHGIFSYGVDVFDNLIDNIYAYSVWQENIEGRNTCGTLKTLESQLSA